jgi:hypothetical protein
MLRLPRSLRSLAMTVEDAGGELVFARTGARKGFTYMRKDLLASALRETRLTYKESAAVDDEAISILLPRKF